MPEKKRGRGRPPKPEAERMTDRIIVRLCPADRRLIERDAKLAGKAMAEILVEGWLLWRARHGYDEAELAGEGDR